MLDQLAPYDRYDYIFLTVRAEQLTQALEQLSLLVGILPAAAMLTSI